MQLSASVHYGQGPVRQELAWDRLLAFSLNAAVWAVAILAVWTAVR